MAFIIPLLLLAIGASVGSLSAMIWGWGAFATSITLTALAAFIFIRVGRKPQVHQVKK